MINQTILNEIGFILFLFSFFSLLILAIIEIHKKRLPTKRKPFVSFIIPTYNDGNLISDTIKSIYESYDKKRFEILVVNDHSRDNTINILDKLKKKYVFKVFSNKTNLGKVRSINIVIPKTRGEIIFVVDSDTLLNKEAVNEIIAKLNDKNIAGASCKYTPRNKGFLAKMQRVEYGMLSMTQLAYNRFSTMSLWGGCMAIKKDILIKAGLFSENAICEDLDMALKIHSLGYKVEECRSSVLSDVPDNWKVWYKQKMRWGAGLMQTLLKNLDYFVEHPLTIIHQVTYFILTIIFIIAIINNITFFNNMIKLFDGFREAGFSLIASAGWIKIIYGYQLIKMASVYILLPIFSIPYIIIVYPQWRKKPLTFLWIFPFAMIYYPIFSVVNIMGFIKGIYKYSTLKKNDRGW